MEWLDEKAIDLAAQAATQLIALGVAVLALIAAWKVATEGTRWRRYALKASWLCYFASLLSGMWFLLALTGTVGAEDTPGVTYGLVRGEPRSLLTPTGRVTFEPAPVAVRLERVDTIGNTQVRMVPVEKPTIWTENTRIPMALQIGTFALGSLLVAVVFLTEFGTKASKSADTETTAA